MISLTATSALQYILNNMKAKNDITINTKLNELMHLADLVPGNIIANLSAVSSTD